MKLIRTLAILFFVDLALILNHLMKPYLVIAGIFYMEIFSSTAITMLFVAACIIIGAGILRKKHWVPGPAKAFALILLANSTLNLVIGAILSADLKGYLARIFDANVYAGYMVLQFLFILVNFWIFVAVKHSRKVFNR